MTRILLIAGHGAGDPGATGNGTTEAAETRRVVNALVAPLRANGFTVTVYDQSKNAFAEAQAGRLNFGGAFDYVFEVHFNAFNTVAKGTEAYVTTSEASTNVEQLIVNSLGKYFVNRGVKRMNFSVIQQAKNRGMSSCLYEMCFIDNAEDMRAYNNNFNSIIQDMANAMARGFGLSVSSGNNNNQPTQQEEITMVCTYQIDGKPTVYYFDGQVIKALNHGDQLKVLREIYKANNGKDLPHFMWKSSAPWYGRLKQVLKLKAE